MLTISQPSPRLQRLCDFIREHGHKAEIRHEDELWAEEVALWQSGLVTREWVKLTATTFAVKCWLGY